MQLTLNQRIIGSSPIGGTKFRGVAQPGQSPRFGNEKSEVQILSPRPIPRGPVALIGRALVLHSRGCRFKSDLVHQALKMFTRPEGSGAGLLNRTSQFDSERVSQCTVSLAR